MCLAEFAACFTYSSGSASAEAECNDTAEETDQELPEDIDDVTQSNKITLKCNLGTMRR